jgi:hypothetical protein
MGGCRQHACRVTLQKWQVCKADIHQEQCNARTTPRPDLHLLRLFVTVVEAGGFSAAQGVLGLSQPSISQQMAKLETRLGYRLCSRGKGGFA